MDVSYAPTVVYSGTGTLPSAVEISGVPDVTPPQGILEQQWLSGQAHAGLNRHVTSRQRLDLRYNRSTRRPSDGPGADSDSQAVSIRHTWAAHQRAAFLFSYRFDENRQNEESGARPPVRYHTADAGVRFDRRVSPTRSVVFSVTGGAAYARVRQADTLDLLEFTKPVGSATVQIDVARAWALSTEVSRSISVLEGVTPEPFASNVGSVRLLGVVDRRTNVSVSFAYSWGAALVTQDGAFESMATTAQVQFAVSRWAALFASYGYYDHSLDNVQTIAFGYPTSYRRHSARVGFTVMLPLFGSF
jgi:hypothetical protein